MGNRDQEEYMTEEENCNTWSDTTCLVSNWIKREPWLRCDLNSYHNHLSSTVTCPHHHLHHQHVCLPHQHLHGHQTVVHDTPAQVESCTNITKALESIDTMAQVIPYNKEELEKEQDH